MATQKKIGNTSATPKANKAVVIPQKVKLTEIEKELIKLRKENTDLREKNTMLETMMLTAGIEVDEKFGDNEDHIIFPSAKEVKGYTDLGRAEEREPALKLRFNSNTSVEGHAEGWELDDDEDLNSF